LNRTRQSRETFVTCLLFTKSFKKCSLIVN
jgi:hypothetical protein